MMGVNGENTDKRSQREILAHEHTIDVQWLLVVQLGNRFVPTTLLVCAHACGFQQGINVNL